MKQICSDYNFISGNDGKCEAHSLMAKAGECAFFDFVAVPNETIL